MIFIMMIWIGTFLLSIIFEYNDNFDNNKSRNDRDDFNNDALIQKLDTKLEHELLNRETS